MSKLLHWLCCVKRSYQTVFFPHNILISTDSRWEVLLCVTSFPSWSEHLRKS